MNGSNLFSSFVSWVEERNPTKPSVTMNWVSLTQGQEIGESQDMITIALRQL